MSTFNFDMKVICFHFVIRSACMQWGLLGQFQCWEVGLLHVLMYVRQSIDYTNALKSALIIKLPLLLSSSLASRTAYGLSVKFAKSIDMQVIFSMFDHILISQYN